MVSSPGGGVGSRFTTSFFGEDVDSVALAADFTDVLAAETTAPDDGPGAAEEV